MKYAILLPTLNEAENIEKVITEIRHVIPQAVIYVVDGLSTDTTRDIASAMGCKVILETQRGKGVAIKRAFREVDADFLLMIDADCTYPIKDIPKFFDLLNEYDAVMGVRLKLEDGSMPIINGIGNKIISLWATLLYLHTASDICTGMWAFRRSAYKNIDVSAQTFELECNMWAQLVKKKFIIHEEPIVYSRRGGASKVRLIDGVKDCLLLLRERVMI